MNLQRLTSYAATAGLAWFAGWLMQPSAPAVPARVQATATAAAGQASDAAAPLIVVASDGNVTLRVEQQPLAWVLEEIAKQSGLSEVAKRAAAAATAAASGAAAEVPVEVPVEVASATPQQAEQLLQAIQRGSEADRFEGLLAARGQGVAVSDEVLKSLFETDASERVRLTAFEAYLEARSGSPETLRSTLAAALYLPNAAIQREARQRLDELAETERIDAATSQVTDP